MTGTTDFLGCSISLLFNPLNAGEIIGVSENYTIFPTGRSGHSV